MSSSKARVILESRVGCVKLIPSGRLRRANGVPGEKAGLSLPITSIVAESPTCLIVDDEPRLRQVLTHLMRADGFRCLEASNGIEALAVLEAESVTLVMSDMQMPKMNGIELLREIRLRQPDVAVVMITGNADVEMAVGALS